MRSQKAYRCFEDLFAVQRLIDFIDDIGCSDGAIVEGAAVETLDGLFTSGDILEFHVDVAVGIGVHSNVNNLAVLGVALIFDLILKNFDPVCALRFQLPTVVSNSQIETFG